MLSCNHLPNQGNSVWTHDTPPEAKSQTVEVIVERISDDGEIEDVQCIECGQPGKSRRRPGAAESDLMVAWFFRWYENATGEYDGERDQIRSQLLARFE